VNIFRQNSTVAHSENNEPMLQMSSPRNKANQNSKSGD